MQEHKGKARGFCLGFTTGLSGLLLYKVYGLYGNLPKEQNFERYIS